jgi:hypothetical protein
LTGADTPVSPYNLAFSALSVIASQQTPEGQILVKVGPMQAEWGDFDIAELFGGAVRKTGIAGDRETDFHTAVHGNDDVAGFVTGGSGGINQRAHAISPGLMPCFPGQVDGLLTVHLFSCIAIHAVPSLFRDQKQLHHLHA